MNYKKIVTHNTYEAAYYLIQGGKFESVESRPVPENKRVKKGYKYVWIITIVDVPERAVDVYRNGSAQANIDQYETARRKLKFLIKRSILKNSHFKNEHP